MKRALAGFLAAGSLLLVPDAVLAGAAHKDFKKSIIEPAPEEVKPALNLVIAEGSYVAESGFRRGAGKFGEQDAAETFLLVAHRFPLDSHWYLKVGGAYHRFDFGTSDAPLETTLQSIALVLALEYFVGDEAGIFIETRPGVYFSDDIDSDSFDAPTTLAFAYPLAGDSLYFIGGLSYAGLREYPLLPLAGVLWRINPQWTLRAYLPEPRLIYKPNDRFAIWAGGELTGGAYRTGHRDVDPGKLSGAVVDYSEYRAGAGFTYAICPAFSIDAAAGYVFSREFDYHRAGEKYGLEGAPYLKLAGRAEF